MRNLFASTAGVIVAGLVLAPAVLAHDIRLPMAADELTVFAMGPQSPDIQFRFTGQGPILLNHDPRVHDTAVVVYGTGFDAGTTGRLDLDPNLWTAIQGPGGITGYTYSDPAGTVGISSITLEQGNLSVIGDGATWPWSPAGPVIQLWFHFLIEDEWLCAVGDFSSTTNANGAGEVSFSDTASPFACPDQVCGNGIREPGELCDDGDLDDTNSCSNDCQALPCGTADFGSTYEGIQAIIFDGVYGCSTDLCHSPAVRPPRGDLDLTAGVSYDQLVNVVSDIPFGGGATFEDRVEPGEPAASFLFEKLSAGTNGTQTTQDSMPTGGPPPLTQEHLDAIELWIRGGAPRNDTVPETGDLLGTCLPDDDPLKLDPPPYPPDGEGIQLRSTAWPLVAQSEDELCFITHYDFTKTNLVRMEDQLPCPAFFNTTNNPSGDCFYYDRRVLRQDSQSHHSIIQIYNGDTDIFNPAIPEEDFGPFTYKPNYPDEPGVMEALCDPLPVDPVTGTCICDPTDPDKFDLLTGTHNECSGRTVSGVACTGFGPNDLATRAPAFSGSQEPYVDNTYTEGVFAIRCVADRGLKPAIGSLQKALDKGIRDPHLRRAAREAIAQLRGQPAPAEQR